MIWRCILIVLSLALTSIVASTGCLGNVSIGEDGLNQEAQGITGDGSADISPAADVTVGSIGIWTITYEAGAEGIVEEGGIRVTIPGLWSPPQISNSVGMGYVTASSESGDIEIEVENNEPEDAVVDAMHDHVTITLVSGSLSEGETITVIYGDTFDGGEGAMASASPREEMIFTVAIDEEGTGTFAEIASSPSLAVIPGEPAAIRIVARQSILYLGETLDVDISLRDQFDNLTTGFSGDVRIEDSMESTATAMGNSAVDVEVLPTESAIRQQLKPTATGMLWLDAEDLTATLAVPTAQSNPVWVLPASEDEGQRDDPRPANLRCYWGDIHAHSICSNDAQSSLDPDDMYDIMSGGTANLHFGAVTDHELWLIHPNYDCDWDESNTSLGPKAAANDKYDEGAFVTFLGYEWTNPTYGHKHVLFYQDNGTVNSDYILSPGANSIPLYSHTNSSYNEPCELWQGYDNLSIGTFDFFTVAHHPANYDNTPPRTDWSEYPSNCPYLGASDWVYQPLVEVYSRHGNNEKIENHATDGMVFTEDDPVHCRVKDTHVVRAALAKEVSNSYVHRMGIIGSGDSHDGRPGLDPSGNADIIELCVSEPYKYQGSEWGNSWYQYPRTGIACTCLEAASFAAGLTRKQVFDALQDRYAYGTTGERIIAWLNIEKTGSAADNYSMGEVGDGDLSADAFEATVHVAKDGEDLDEVRLMWLDPGESPPLWKICKTWTTGTDWPDSLTEEVDLVAEGCTDSEEIVYYLVAEQDYIRETQFRVSDINKYIKFTFKDNGVETTYTATLQTSWYASGSTMAAEVEEKMEDECGANTLTVSYSAMDHKFTIGVADTVNDEIKFLWGTPTFTTNAAYLLGFDRSDSPDFETSHESDWAIWSDGFSPRGMVWTSPIWMTYTE